LPDILASRLTELGNMGCLSLKPANVRSEDPEITWRPLGVTATALTHPVGPRSVFIGFPCLWLITVKTWLIDYWSLSWKVSRCEVPELLKRVISSRSG